MRADLIRGHLDMLVLTVVSGGPSHGYAIVEEMRRRSGGEFELREGTLYPALYRLEGEGLLASEWKQAGGRRRRVYRLTRAGRRALEAKERDWFALVQAVGRVIGGPA